MPEWLAGSFVGLGPAGGKSTLAGADDAVHDVECSVAWPALRAALSTGRSPNWEDTVDTVALFFRGAVPGILAAMLAGRTAVAHCIDPKSSWLAGLFVSGLERTVVATVADEDLERRVADRAAKRSPPAGRALDWYQQCHTTWIGLAHRFGLPLVPANALVVARPLSDDRGRHICRFAAGAREWTLVEVLPRQFALWSGATLAAWLVADDGGALVRQPWVASTWGRTPVEWATIRLDGRTVVLDGRAVPMLQEGDAGGAFLPTWHVVGMPQPVGGSDTIPAKRSLRPSGQPRTGDVVLVYLGSFAPFHRGHREVLELARATLVGAGRRVVGAYVVPAARLRDKAAPIPALRPWTVRAAIAQLSLRDAAVVSFGAEQVAQQVQRMWPGGAPAVVWVNGADVEVDDYMQWLCRGTDQVDLLFVGRGAAALPTAGDRVLLCSAEPALRLSSTAVRAALLRGARTEAARDMCNGAAAAYAMWAVHEAEMQ